MVQELSIRWVNVRPVLMIKTTPSFFLQRNDAKQTLFRSLREPTHNPERTPGEPPQNPKKLIPIW